MNNKLTILYERLSRDDDIDGLSNSIANQQMVLEKYAKEHRYEPFIHLFDDGVTGSRFDRPGFVKMIEQVESGNVARIVTKDLSRLGREHLRVGLYLEDFKERGIQYIAVNDGVDTQRGEDDFLPFRNIINEWYARDCSRKIKSIFKTRASEGKHISPNTPYGYVRSPEDKQQWIVEPESAAVVRRIFAMAIDGKGITHIAKILTDEKILSPSAHYDAIGDEQHHNYSDPYKWQATAVARILEKREYTGATVNFKSYKDSYKSKKRKKSAPEDMVIFPDTHEAIVDEATYETAQKCRRTIRRRPKSDIEPCRLTGLVYCYDCGSRMHHASHEDNRPGRSGKHNEYVCTKYRTQAGCSLHYIRVEVLEELILTTIREVCDFARDSEDEFVKKIREISATRQKSIVTENRKKITKAEKRQTELMSVVKKLLEANATGRIPDSHFDKMFAEYADEQEQLERSIAEWRTEIEDYEADSLKADGFIELVRRYTNFDELTTQMLNEFVDKIYIHEADKSSGKRVQQVDIHLTFIGHFIAPKEEIPLTPEQIEAERKEDERRANRREITRRYREKKKAKIAAEAAATA
ncbi:recombinase [Clostridia bacterium]|nr:recombinase [Clostridia bacterium]